MVNHSPARVVLMFVGFFVFLVSITFNSLSGFGAKSGVFKQSTEDVTIKYTTPITPAQWSLFVWDFIYIWVFAMFIYFLVGLCRRSAYNWLYTTPAVLPYGFHVTIIINVCFNITFLFLFDRELMLPVLIISILMTLTDYMILFFSCHGLKIYGAWLHKYHNIDLWLIRILVQNGVAVYATWGTLSTLLNLTIYLQHQIESSCATVSLPLLLMELLVWFLLENFYFDEHVRYIVTIYPVVILWLTGTLSNSDSPGSYIYKFEAVILAISCIMFVARIALVTWKHHKRPLYKDSGPSLSPVESSEQDSDTMVRFHMSPLSAKNTDHVVVHAGSVGLAVVAQVIANVFCKLADDGPNALFQTSSRNVSETFPLEVTMDWWSESFWIMIDFWSTAWLLYAVFSLFKRNVHAPESSHPEIHPPVFYFMWTLVNMARICSMLMWDRHDILGAVILRWFLPVLSFYMLYMSYSNLNKHKAWLAINNPWVISWTRYLTQNGLAVFAWWSLLNALVGFGIVLKYEAGVPDPLISTIVLTMVSLFTTIWFILQSCLLVEYMRYTFTVYAILILGLGAMFTRSYRVHDLAKNTVYCGFLMLLMTVMSLIHLICACLHTDKTSSKPVSTELCVSGEDCETVWHTDLRSDNIKRELSKKI